jgi:uncharacterized cupin superfamily protein
MPKIDLEAARRRTRIVYPEPYRSVTKGYEQHRVGDAAGLTQFGVNRVVMAPGAQTSLRHWHEVQDEFVIILSGEAVLIEEGMETVLRVGDCAGFKAGVENGHCFANRSDEPVIMFEIGTHCDDDTAHYPDVDLRAEKRDGIFSFVHVDGTPYPAPDPS